MEEFYLKENDFIPLCDLLKVVGLCATGGEAKAVIADGRVRVDGIVELRKRCKIRDGQVVDFSERQIRVRAGAPV